MQMEKPNRIISLMAALAVLFSIFPALQGSAAAEFREERVLDCRYDAPVGEGFAGYAVHVHNITATASTVTMSFAARCPISHRMFIVMPAMMPRVTSFAESWSCIHIRRPVTLTVC